ncbi:uncharacterized protein [Cicer arietinum]|uniref:Uncharacterized protein LOC101510087 n=1 Tax=Cicer arietinum TaxID=3827 RepID=A0A1S2YNE7_CICAR|nr:uncharacterized protein LOC101510087 [Cicer arietinum]
MMPDEISASACHDGERVDAHAMHGYLSPWMAHWKKHTSYNNTATTPACNRLSVGCELKEMKEDSDAEQRDLVGGSEVGSDSSMHAAEVGDAAGVTRVAFLDEEETGKWKKGTFDSKSFLISSLSQKLNGRSAFQREEKSVFREEDGKSGTESCSGDDNVYLNRDGGYLPIISAQAAASPKIETSVKECQLSSQGVPVKSPCAAEQKSLGLSTSLRNNLVTSASEIVPTNGRDKGKTVMPQITGGPLKVYRSSYNLASQEHYPSTKYQSYSSLCIRDKKTSSLLDPQRSSLPRLMQGSFSHFPNDPIADSDDDGLHVVHSQHRKIQNLIANPDITNQTALFESTKPQNFYGVSSLEALVPRSVHNVKAAKIYTSIDSIEESSRGHPKISQTTHCSLMSKNTDVNSSDRGQFFRELVAPTKFKGNNFNKILDLSPTPPMSDHTVECLKPKTLGRSRKSEWKENIQDFKCPTSLMNESSSEPDTMDIDTLHESNLPGEVPSQSNKCSKDSQNSPASQGAPISARGKNLEKSVNTSLLDINKEPHEPPTLASPMVDRETSTSRTHSLDVEQLFSHANGQARSKSTSSSLGSDPSSRWVKRLKLCTLEPAHGTKSETIGETSVVKLNHIFSKIMKDSKTNSKPKTVNQAEGQRAPDPRTTVLSNDESSFTEVKETVEITLSHPWIRRWSHNRATCSKKRCELSEPREPKSSNTVPDELQNKQFPSIAAMALMGKAMNCLNASELTKKGPVVVWNTKRL